MAEFPRIEEGVGRLGDVSGVLARRLIRLKQRLECASAPIMWLCAGAGSGKSRLIEALQPSVGERKWTFLDDPPAAILSSALEGVTGIHGADRPRLLVATRPQSANSALLLKSPCLELTEALADADLFVRMEDTTPQEEYLIAATGGWPWLIDAALSGREAAVRALLPEFLEREVLPHLPDGVVAALFAALRVSLPPSALEHLGAEFEHPLLAKELSGARIAGDWVREALLALSSGAVARSAGVRERLMHLYTSQDNPAPAIEELLSRGDWSTALEVFRQAGGAYYGYHHGYHALERVLALFGPEFERRSEEILLARLWTLVKTGRTREALLRLEAQHPGLPVDLRSPQRSYRPELLLLRADMSLDLDDMPPLEIVASWGRLQEIIVPGDDLSQGILYNLMAIGHLQADALVEARQLAERALGAYECARLPYLAHFMHVHLAEVALRQSRLADAAGHLERAELMLAASGHEFNSERAILASLKSRIAFERGHFEHSANQIGPLLEALVVGDSWPDLLPRVAPQVVLAAFWRHGLKSALEQLDRCALAQSRRHGVIVGRRLKLLRIRLLQVARRHTEAQMLLEEYDLAPDAHPSAALEIESGLIRLRLALERQNSGAERIRLSAVLARHPALEIRQRISLALLEAAGRQLEGAEAAARRHLRLALREAHAQGLVAVLIEDGECLERLLPGFIAVPGPGNARLAAFAASVLRLLRRLPMTPMRSENSAGLSRQEHRVLSYVADGYSNKQTARALGLTESTVKFHVQNLFRKLAVGTRAALGEAAGTRGILT
jgi:DNA-binding CsgD family transcriptional regulator